MREYVRVTLNRDTDPTVLRRVDKLVNLVALVGQPSDITATQDSWRTELEGRTGEATVVVGVNGTVEDLDNGESVSVVVDRAVVTSRPYLDDVRRSR